VLIRLVRRAAVLALLIAGVRVAWGYGRLAAALTALGELIALAAVTIWLPRAAHRAFERGGFGRSAFHYHVLRWLTLDREARRSIDVSLAACDLARGEHARALRRLGAIEPDQLGEAARSAWLNNRAYALARSGRDAAAALDCADRAIALRPEVPGFRHTRGVALLALGRTDEAIKELDAVWSALEGDPPPMLEAERCCDLGLAWTRKGERDYARDYFIRAQRAAPDSVWAARAADALGDADEALATRAVLPDLV
jgi:tetratricopeptide (TPR) repeat protein